MSYIPLKCKNCGADMSREKGADSATCKHCGSTFLISELLDNEKEAHKQEKLKVKTNSQSINKEIGFSINDTAYACIIFILLTNLFSSALGFLGIKLVSGTFGYYLTSALVELVFAAAAVFVAYTRKKNIIKSTGMDKKINGNIVGWCFLISFVSLLAFGNLTNVFMEILVKLGYSSILGNIELVSFGQYIGMLLASCIVAAFAEELLFRGVIQSGLNKWGIRISVGVSALIFMLMHGNAEQTVHQFVIGVIIGYIFYKTHNLWIGVLVHMFNNFIPVTQAYLLSLFPATDAAAEVVVEQIGWGTILIDFVLALITAWAGLYFLKMIFKKIFQEDAKLNGTQQTNENVASIKVDGDETKVEMTIEGLAVSENQETAAGKKERPKLSPGTIIMFSVAGVYLIGTWIFYTICGFLM